MPYSSVVVCSYTPGTEVVTAIEALLGERSRIGAPEVILVVHRASQPFQDFLAKLGNRPRLKVIEDPGIGLSYARNLGVREATGTLVAFLDDTASPDPGWLEALETAFETQGCDAVGGEILPSWERPLPSWVDPLLEISIGAKRTLARGFLSFPETPFGANMAFRRDVFERFGSFDESLGRFPGSALSNEEVALFYRIYAAGGKVYFEPAARVHHRVPNSRLTKKYARRRAYWQGISRVRMYRALGWTPPPVLESLLAIAKHSVAGIRHFRTPRLRMKSEILVLTRIGELVEEFQLTKGRPNLGFDPGVIAGPGASNAPPWQLASRSHDGKGAG